MTQGVFVNGKRPATKKAIKEALASGQEVSLEATSIFANIFGNEYDGPITSAPDGFYTFTGPDPERSRKYYGNFIVADGKVTLK